MRTILVRFISVPEGSSTSILLVSLNQTTLIYSFILGLFPTPIIIKEKGDLAKRDHYTVGSKERRSDESDDSISHHISVSLIWYLWMLLVIVGQ